MRCGGTCDQGRHLQTALLAGRSRCQQAMADTSPRAMAGSSLFQSGRSMVLQMHVSRYQ